MNDNSIKTSLTDKILNKLKDGKFKMKPKIYFILKVALIILSTLIVAIFSLFLISFIGFALRASGVLVLPIFGLIIVAVILVAVLEALFKHFSFAYSRPILYSIVGIIIVVFLGSFIINRTPFHSRLFDRARERRLPIFGPMYRNFGPRSTAPFHKDFIR